MYQSLLHLTWVDKLLDNIKIIFVDLYRDQLKKPHTSVVECDFDGYFNQQYHELEGTSDQQSAPTVQIVDTESAGAEHRGIHDLSRSIGLSSGTGAPLSARRAVVLTPFSDLSKPSPNATSSTENSPVPTPDSSRPATPAAQNITSKLGPKGSSRRARKVASALANPSSEDERRAKPKQDVSKKMRRWTDDGMAEDGEDVVLDYSQPASGPGSNAQGSTVTAIDLGEMEESGIRTEKGQYVVRDYGDEAHTILQNAQEKTMQSAATSKAGGIVGSSLGAISGLFRNVVGGKVLAKEDLEKSMKAMEEHLLNKNIAREAAVRLCEGVERELIGYKTGNFESELAPFLYPFSNLHNMPLRDVTRDKCLYGVRFATAC